MVGALAGLVGMIAAAVSPASVRGSRNEPGRSFAEFLPSKHGFAFRNQFTGSPLPVSLGGLEKSLGAPSNYGLCGGMSFAAADFFCARLAPPLADTPPKKGEALYQYLYSRQADSLGSTFEFVPKFVEWMAAPDATVVGTRAMTLWGIPAIVNELRAGKPVVLGLVLQNSKKGGVLWENHQVLAYGVGDPSAGTRKIRIYDPNFPKSDDAVIETRSAVVGFVTMPSLSGSPVMRLTPVFGVDATRRASGRRDTPVRGFFAMRYKAKAPPRGLAGSPD